MIASPMSYTLLHRWQVFYMKTSPEPQHSHSFLLTSSACSCSCMQHDGIYLYVLWVARDPVSRLTTSSTGESGRSHSEFRSETSPFATLTPACSCSCMHRDNVVQWPVQLRRTAHPAFPRRTARAIGRGKVDISRLQWKSQPRTNQLILSRRTKIIQPLLSVMRRVVFSQNRDNA